MTLAVRKEPSSSLFFVVEWGFFDFHQNDKSMIADFLCVCLEKNISSLFSSVIKNS